MSSYLTDQGDLEKCLEAAIGMGVHGLCLRALTE